MSLVVDMSVVRIDDTVGVSSQPRSFAALSTSPRRLEQLTYTKQQPAIGLFMTGTKIIVKEQYRQMSLRRSILSTTSISSLNHERSFASRTTTL